ncbi:MAG: hypothetical protein ACR2MT_06650 [Aurantibacter sp.]
MGAKGYFSVFNTLMVLLCSTYQICAQDNPVFNNILGKLTTYTNLKAPEKVYLQTDKDYYTRGEIIWFKTYIINGISNTISDKSRVVYVELVDSKHEIFAQRKVYAGFDGGSGDIALAKDIKGGNYLLRAYTKYMLNDRDPVFFQKEILVWTQELNSNDISEKASKEKKRRKQEVNNEIAEIKTKKPVVQFFPEGGNLVTGLKNVLGLKITDEKGTGIALEGRITDQDGSLISMFRSYEFGLGQLQFMVEPNTNYYAEIEVDGRTEKYPIPKPISEGYVLQVSNKGEFIQIRAITNIPNGLNGTLLLGHLRGDLILKHFQENKAQNTYELKLLTSKLNDGVASFTLFTPEGEPVCERLVFIENPDNSVNLSLKTNTSNYGLRKKVNVDLALVDEIGLPLNGNFSISVSSQKGLKEEPENIKSWLLLNSDLRGAIENPNYFFVDDSKGRKNLLDMLMLTHGWRRFVWHEFVTNETDTKLQFPPEKGIVISGNTVSLKNRHEPLKSSVRLTVTKPSAYEEETSTDSHGKFSFGPMVFRDSIKAVINAAHDVDSKKEIAIYLEPPFPNVPFNDLIRVQNQLHTMVVEQAYLEEVYRKKIIDFEYDSKVIKLDEVIGKAKSKTKKELLNEALNSRTAYGQALNSIVPDSIPDGQFNSVLDLIERNVAGVRVSGSYPNQSVRLRPVASFSTPSTPLYLLDGIAVDPSLVLEMFGGEVLFIDVLKSAGEIAQYGSRGANGVIAIYTDRGENYEFVQEKEPDVANFMIPGFYRAREFYSPIYSLVKPEHDKPDYRTTLHWEPDIKVSDVEPTYLSFYIGDNAGVYTIRVEGITDDGRPVSGVYTFKVVED